LILIGEGSQRDNLEKKVESLASASKIEFLGFRPDRLKLVKEMNLFCMTSSLEGIPRCMMEAMALEVPVVAFNIPGVDRLIIPEKTGLLAPFGDIEALKSCWKRILFKTNNAGHLGENGRRHIEENFSARRMAEEYNALYRELVADR
jgi:glycosyltransferase involved in cell wall biosynthesis